MQIRAERAEDAAAIHRLVREAFATAPHRSGTEPHIVDALRAAGALSVSLLAERQGAIVGHVAISPVELDDGTPGWFGLGPLAVAPDHQRQGIGTALVRAALAALEAHGASGCVVLGDPGYYRRFGFAADPRLRLPGVPDGYFQALPLRGPLPAADVRYHREFDTRP